MPWPRLAVGQVIKLAVASGEGGSVVRIRYEHFARKTQFLIHNGQSKLSGMLES